MRIANPLICIIVAFGLSTSLLTAQTSAPATRPVGPVPANPKLPTIWIVGDSTASNNANGGLGWGTPFQKLFDKTKVNIVNRARGGRSSRSFQVEGLWDETVDAIKPGDFVLLQWGHNDGGSITNPNGRPSLPGLGDESEEITKVVAGKETKETVHTYGWYMRKYVTDAKAKRATIIVLSSVPHMPKQPVKDGDVETNFRHVGWAEEVARSQNVPFVHVNKIVMSKYAGIDPQEIKTKYFTPPGDGTHTNPDGAALNAASVLEGLKQLKDLPFAGFLLEK